MLSSSDGLLTPVSVNIKNERSICLCLSLCELELFNSGFSFSLYLLSLSLSLFSSLSYFFCLSFCSSLCSFFLLCKLFCSLLCSFFCSAADSSSLGLNCILYFSSFSFYFCLNFFPCFLRSNNPIMHLFSAGLYPCRPSQQLLMYLLYDLKITDSSNMNAAQEMLHSNK